MKKVYVVQKEFNNDGEISFDMEIFANEEDAKKHLDESVTEFTKTLEHKDVMIDKDTYPYKAFAYVPYDDYHLDIMVVEKEIK